MLTRHLVETLLGADSSDIRFEDFCNQVLTADLGIRIVNTSRSWDLGRDGRSITPGLPAFVATSLRKDVEDKARSDAKRIRENVPNRPISLYVCASTPVSELAAEKITEVVLKELPAGSEVHPLGSNHLAEIGLRHVDVLERLYKSELDEVRRLLSSPRDNESEAETSALRLALMTAGSPDSALLRTETYRAAIVSVLSDGRKRTIGELARDVSHGFRLTRLLAPEVLSPVVEMMVQDAEVQRDSGGLQLAEAGREFSQKATNHAAETLLAGRLYIRERLERAVGMKLADQQFERAWRAIQDTISKAFYERGQQLVASVTALINGTADSEFGSGLSFIDDLAEACSLVTSHADQREEIRTAVVDLFREPSGPAFDWLVELCAGFVTVCSLGLEVQSGQKIAEILRRFTLVLDTDVTLSLLCEGEPDHEAMAAIQQRMGILGGGTSDSRLGCA